MSSTRARSVLAAAALLLLAFAARAQSTVTALDADARLLIPATTFTLQARVTAGTPQAGVTVTFTAPASGPSATFGNGSNVGTAVTDANGVATITGTPSGGAGLVQVVADCAGCASASNVFQRVVAGPLQIVAGPSTRYTFGQLTTIGYRVLAPWVPCSLASVAATWFAAGAAMLTVNGMSAPSLASLPAGTCTGGMYIIFVTADLRGLLPGEYDIDMLYGAPAGIGSVEARAKLTVDPEVVLPASGGAGPYQFGLEYTIASGQGTCASITGRAGRPGDDGYPAAGPPGVAVPSGLLRVDATSCTWNPLTSTAPTGTFMQQALLGTGAPLPDGTEVWAWGPSADNSQPHWYRVAAVISGSFARFEMVDGGAGDNSTGEDRELHAMLALAQPAAGDFTRGVQGLWWAGAQENGWGMTLVQHDDRLFAGLYVYDAMGEPTWVVVPGGSWNAAHTAYTGNVYRPHGAPFTEYDVKQFSAGTPVGTVTLTFASRDALALDYVIDGASGHKSMQRQSLGAPDIFYGPALADLWWGGPTQNGWGLAIAQQDSTAFGVLFTYDANGNPTWFVLPSLRFGTSAFTSKVYRTHGSPWLGATYDASRFSTTEVGAATLFFNSFSALLQYSVNGVQLSQALVRQPF